VRNRLAPKLVNQPTRRHSPGPAQDSQASATKAALVASIYRCLTKSRFTWEPECCPRIAGRNRPSRTAPTRRTPRRIARRRIQGRSGHSGRPLAYPATIVVSARAPQRRQDTVASEKVSPQSNLRSAVPVRHWRFRVLGSFGGSLSKTGGRQWVSRSAGSELMHIKTAERSPRPTRLPPRSSERSRHYI
jgi:hypothetical protein